MLPLEQAFTSALGRAAAFVARAPGRVNLIGEHTDYNDGFVLPMAINRDVTLVGAARGDRTVRIRSLDFDQTAEFSLDFIQPDSRAPWSNYIRGVAVALRDTGFALRGFDAVMKGEVPIGSGLSSSAATEMAALMAFKAAAAEAGAPLDEARLDGTLSARLAQRAENHFVGVKCGIMDQFISSLGQAGHALKIDCRSLAFERVPMPPGATVLVVDTAAPRTLAGSAYNARRSECEAGAKLLGYDSLRDVPLAEFKRQRDSLPTPIMLRVGHVLLENRRTLDAVEAMKRGDLEELGLLMNHSHESLRDLYEVSSPELDAVVEIARAQEGVHGARMTGAGFGGCAIALVDDARVEAVSARIAEEYPRLSGRTPTIYPCVAADGARYQLLRATLDDGTKGR